MTERVQKLIDYLEKENLVTTYNNQWFDSRNIAGDCTEAVYRNNGITVYYCEDYGYFEVFTACFDRSRLSPSQGRPQYSVIFWSILAGRQIQTTRPDIKRTISNIAKEPKQRFPN